MLGLDNVPPTVPRNLDGQRGSVQLWIERSTSEGQRIRNNERLAWPARWSRQRHTMFVFDNLIYNFDRNHGNMLVDTTGKLWLVDHTRSFKKLPKLRAPEQIVVVDRRLWDRLRQLDPREVRRRSRPYLDSIEIQSLLRRHRLLVAHIEQLIAERGADAVLIGG